MFIQTEETPNPSTLKFIPGQAVLENKTKQFNSKEDAAISPLATRLFNIQHVEAVFLGRDFVAVTKSREIEWDLLKAEVLTSIMEHFVSGDAVINESETEVKQDDDVEENGVIKQIKELIETKIRPAVAQDGGDIIYHGFENGIVKLEMHGACSGCPSASVTLKQGIENMLKHYVPEVLAVEAVA